MPSAGDERGLGAEPVERHDADLAYVAHDGRSGYTPVAEYEMLGRFARGAAGANGWRGLVARVACLLILALVIAGVVLSVVRVA